MIPRIRMTPGWHATDSQSNPTPRPTRAEHGRTPALPWLAPAVVLRCDAAGSYFTQSVSGDVGDLSEGDYYVGLCAEDQNDVQNGAANVTITMAETASGVTYDGVKAAPRRPGRQ
jgi:hypothetical protein